jgi:hypothetical protein
VSNPTERWRRNKAEEEARALPDIHDKAAWRRWAAETDAEKLLRERRAAFLYE